jgi:hypothetical protein
MKPEAMERKRPFETTMGRRNRLKMIMDTRDPMRLTQPIKYVREKIEPSGSYSHVISSRPLSSLVDVIGMMVPSIEVFGA